MSASTPIILNPPVKPKKVKTVTEKSVKPKKEKKA